MARAAAQPLTEAIAAKLAPLGPMRAKPMFSGYGLYLDGVIFGLILRENFYLKVDDENRPDFVKAGSAPFRYETRQRQVTVDSYWLCPAPIAGNAAKLRAWVEKSLAASRRANAKKKPRSTKPRPRRNPFL